MLQHETQNLERQKEELAFYSNQCLEETRRVGKDNGKILIAHFIQMSQLQCSYINQTHTLYADFLSHFQTGEGEAALNEDELAADGGAAAVMGGPVRKDKEEGTGSDGGSGGTAKLAEEEAKF